MNSANQYFVSVVGTVMSLPNSPQQGIIYYLGQKTTFPSPWGQLTSNN